MSSCVLFAVNAPGNYCGRGKSKITHRSQAWNVAGMANRATVPVFARVLIMWMRCGGNLNAKKGEQKEQR